MTRHVIRAAPELPWIMLTVLFGACSRYAAAALLPYPGLCSTVRCSRLRENPAKQDGTA
jgi:hypothetical protein